MNSIFLIMAWPVHPRSSTQSKKVGIDDTPKHGMGANSGIETGFNMEPGTAVFVTYAAHLVDGNLVTDLLSIGEKTRKTGPDPPAPAIVGGLNTHAVFEGMFLPQFRAGVTLMILSR
jgi:hypothetical protein